MNLCRICLSTSPNKDIHKLKIDKNNESKSYSEILQFCLNIQVTEDSKLTTKLCSTCYKKILDYYKFKTLALKNDRYLKTLNLHVFVQGDQECSNINNNPIKIKILGGQYYEAESLDNDSVNSDVKEEYIKIENDDNDYQSDDELLSVIKQIKEENPMAIDSIPLEEDSKVIVKRRGRPKKIKTESCVPNKQICEECGESVKDLKQHAVRHLPAKDRKRIPCQLCDKTFCSYGARYKHKKLIHLGIRYRCQECGKEVANLKSHLIRMHHPELLKIVCVMCDKRFISQSLLDLHMLQHTKDRPNECDICRKRFRLKITLELHKRQVHELEKSHLCQFCPKTFFKKYHLDNHLRSHTKEKPYKCDECGRAFSDKSTLRNHQDTHKTERNFHCDHCDMKFVRRDYLRAHLVCHTKEKRYPCKYCGLRFGRSDHRKRHQYTAHEKHLQLPPPVQAS